MRKNIILVFACLIWQKWGVITEVLILDIIMSFKAFAAPGSYTAPLDQYTDSHITSAISLVNIFSILTPVIYCFIITAIVGNLIILFYVLKKEQKDIALIVISSISVGLSVFGLIISILGIIAYILMLVLSKISNKKLSLFWVLLLPLWIGVIVGIVILLYFSQLFSMF